MENIDEQCPEALNLKFDRMMLMFRDVILLENQLPSKMLDILCKEKGLNLEYCYSNYHHMGECKRLGKVLIPLGYHIQFHVLDTVRSVFVVSENIEGQNQFELSDDVCNEELGFNWNTYKSIQDLKKVGIQVMANEKEEWSNISFTSKWFSGELRLPRFVFNDVTPYVFRNLIAYEMCPDVHYNYECCSFFSFMDSLVDNAEDVKELRLAGVFQNLLGSDEQLAKLFNDLGDDLPTKMCCHESYTNAVSYSKKYIQIKRQIERHYKNKWKTWLAQAYNTHFNTPWAMIAFLAASLALLLTLIQTWYAIHPK
jgi:hypothetical protein